MSTKTSPTSVKDWRKLIPGTPTSPSPPSSSSPEGRSLYQGAASVKRHKDSSRSPDRGHMRSPRFLGEDHDEITTPPAVNRLAPPNTGDHVDPSNLQSHRELGRLQSLAFSSISPPGKGRGPPTGRTSSDSGSLQAYSEGAVGAGGRAVSTGRISPAPSKGRSSDAPRPMDQHEAHRHMMAGLQTTQAVARITHMSISEVESQINRLDDRKNTQDVHITKITKVLKLRKSPIMKMFSESELRIIADKCHIVRVSEANFLINQGDPSTSMFIIIQGAFKILVDFTGAGDLALCEQVDISREGDVIGEMGMITGERRKAFVQAAAPCEVLEITLPIIRALCLARPDLKSKIEEHMQAHIGNFEQKHSASDQKSSELQQEVLAKIEASMKELEEYKKGVKEQKRNEIKGSIKRVYHKKKAHDMHDAVQAYKLQMQESLRAGIIATWPLIELSSETDERAQRALEMTLRQHPEIPGLINPEFENHSMLHEAARLGAVRLCTIMMSHGAQVNTLDLKHRTSLHWAVQGAEEKHCQHHLHTVRLLLAAGAQQTRDEDGFAPLDLCHRDDIRFLLLDHLHHVQLSLCWVKACQNRKPGIICRRCKLVMYCCQEHARRDWEKHQETCRPEPVELSRSQNVDALITPRASNRVSIFHKKLEERVMGQKWKEDPREGHIGLNHDQWLVKGSLHSWQKFVWIHRAELSKLYRKETHDIRNPTFSTSPHPPPKRNTGHSGSQSHRSSGRRSIPRDSVDRLHGDTMHRTRSSFHGPTDSDANINTRNFLARRRSNPRHGESPNALPLEEAASGTRPAIPRRRSLVQKQEDTDRATSPQDAIVSVSRAKSNASSIASRRRSSVMLSLDTQIVSPTDEPKSTRNKGSGLARRKSLTEPDWGNHHQDGSKSARDRAPASSHGLNTESNDKGRKSNNKNSPTSPLSTPLSAPLKNLVNEKLEGLDNKAKAFVIDRIGIAELGVLVPEEEVRESLEEQQAREAERTRLDLIERIDTGQVKLIQLTIEQLKQSCVKGFDFKKRKREYRPPVKIHGLPNILSAQNSKSTKSIDSQEVPLQVPEPTESLEDSPTYMPHLTRQGDFKMFHMLSFRNFEGSHQL